VVSAPRSDSFPVTLHEAMACGTPVVVGDLPPIRAVLGDLAPDFLVPWTGVAEMADAIRRALALGPRDRERLGRSLRRHVVETADYETNMLRMEGIYLDLARRGR
jgi:glycosyltransferase involved in cell wall biosynthesis